MLWRTFACATRAPYAVSESSIPEIALPNADDQLGVGTYHPALQVIRTDHLLHDVNGAVVWFENHVCPPNSVQGTYEYVHAGTNIASCPQIGDVVW